MKIIVLHDRYSDEPIVIRVDAITAIQKIIDKTNDSEEEYSGVYTTNAIFYVREHIDVVMLRIKNADKAEARKRNESTISY